jgi:hypothetical protein
LHTDDDLLQVQHTWGEPDHIARLSPAREEQAKAIAASFTPTLESYGKTKYRWDCARCTKSRMNSEALRGHCGDM